MRPTMYPRLVNDRFGDPGVFVEFLHRRDALLFDLGDLSPLSARDLLRISHVFVTHMHMDHFIGFDALLRVSVGREKRIRVLGPDGICERLFHKLQGYEWDLTDRYAADLVFEAADIGHQGPVRSARFRFKRRFAWEDAGLAPAEVEDAGWGLRLSWALLEHHGTSVGYAVSEPAHANVWKNRLEERGLQPGQWLQALKQAVIDGAANDTPIALPGGSFAPLGSLREVVSMTRGQKIAYVSDVGDTPFNRGAIARLAAGADRLFIESSFAAEDAEQARIRAHLTTAAAGEIARAAAVRKVEPFHFSPRYEGQEERMLAEVFSAFGDDRAITGSDCGAFSLESSETVGEPDAL